MSKRTLSHSPIFSEIDCRGLTSIDRVPALILSREATVEYRLFSIRASAASGSYYPGRRQPAPTMPSGQK